MHLVYRGRVCCWLPHYTHLDLGSKKHSEVHLLPNQLSTSSNKSTLPKSAPLPFALQLQLPSQVCLGCLWVQIEVLGAPLREPLGRQAVPSRLLSALPNSRKLRFVHFRTVHCMARLTSSKRLERKRMRPRRDRGTGRTKDQF